MQPSVCPECGTPVGEADRCWLCYHPIGSGAGVSAAAAASGPTEAATRFTFGLSSLMIWIAGIACFLGVMRAAPGLGVALLLVSTPALIRATVAGSRRRALGRPMTATERVWAFLGSLGVVAATGAAASAAFAATCFTGVFLGAATSTASQPYAGLAIGFYVGAGLGLLAGAYVLYRFIKRFWPIKDSS